MDWIEIVGFVTGAACVWLAAREHVANFPVGLVNTALFLVLFWQTGIYANAGLQVLYLVLGVLGWYWWLRGGRDGGALVVRRAPALAWLVGAIGVVAGTAGLTVVLGTWTDSATPFLDALTTATSVVAQVMLDRKWIGSWAVWIVTDVLLVGLFASQGLVLTAVLYVVYLGICVMGLRHWRSVLRAQESAPVGSSLAEPTGAEPAVLA